MRSTPVNKKKGDGPVTLPDRLFPVFLIVVLGWICYSGSLQGGFQFDDYSSIVENPAIGNLSDLPALFVFAKTRFITYLSFALQRHIHGLQPFPFLLLNIMIHLGSALILYFLLRLLFCTPELQHSHLATHERTIALAASLLFLTHPLQTQAVAYIVQRATSMAVLFFLLSLFLYTKARIHYHDTRQTHLPYYSGALLAALLAMFTKEISFTLPLCVLLTEYFFFSPSPARIKRNFKHLYPMLLTLFVIPLTYFLTMRGTISHIGLAAETRNISRLDYLLTQFSVIRTYLRLLFLPLRQSVDYDFPIAHRFLEPATLASFLLLLALFILGLLLFRKHRLISFGILWFFLSLPVESGLIPIRDVIFEHRAYLPSIGILLSATTLIFLLTSNRPRMTFASFALLVSLCSAATIHRTVIWSHQVLLWHDAHKGAPEKIRPFLNRGVGYDMLNKKDLALEDFNRVISRTRNDPLAYVNRGLVYMHMTEYESAVSDFSRALSLAPGLAKAYANRAIANLMMKKHPEALRDFQAASRIEPQEPFHVNGMGTVCKEVRRYDWAIYYFTKAIVIDENYFAPYLNRGIVSRREGRFYAALGDFDRAAELSPELPEIYYHRGLAHAGLGQNRKAVADFSRSLVLAPEYVKAYNNRGIIYDRLGLPARAILDFDRAVELDPSLPKLYRNRGGLYRRLGREQKALSDFRKAERLEESEGAKSSAGEDG